MEMMIDLDRSVHGLLLSNRWISSLQCRDTGMKVRMIVREQLVLSLTIMRNHLDVYSLVSGYLAAVVM